MPKSDHKHHNQSQEHEQNYQLRKHGLRQTKENRDLLDKITPPYSKNTDMDTLIQKNLKKYLTNNKMYDIMNKLLRDSENELNIEN